MSDDLLMALEDGTELVVREEIVEVIEVAAQGPAGPPGASGAGSIEIAFAFGDATPKVLLTAPANKTVYGAGLHIHTAFNGTGAALSIGDAGDPARLMAATANAPDQVASYLTSPNHRYGVPTALILTITPGGGATQGAGIVSLQVQQ